MIKFKYTTQELTRRQAKEGVSLGECANRLRKEEILILLYNARAGKNFTDLANIVEYLVEELL